MKPPRIEGALDAALTALRSDRPDVAKAHLTAVLRLAPKTAQAHKLLGDANRMLRDAPAAEAAFRQSIRLDRRQPRTHVALAELLEDERRLDEAEQAYRAALALNRRHVPAAVGLCHLLVRRGQFAKALRVTAPLAAGAAPGEAVLTAHALALKGLKRFDEALALQRQAVAVAPQSGVAEHNLAAGLGDQARYQEAEVVARRAIAKGVRAPETWLVLGRALQGQGQWSQAETAYRNALSLSPKDAEVHQELAQLVWMQTGDAGAATSVLDQALASGATPDLVRVKATALTYAGDLDAAKQVLAAGVAAWPGDTALLEAAADAANATGDPRAALVLAERALATAPDEMSIWTILAQLYLASGEPDRAGFLAQKVLSHHPDDQLALALQATAWRLMGDLRYRDLCDYEALVQRALIATPANWKDLDSYLADLRAALRLVHGFHAHPFNQSLRGGTQASDLLNSEAPAIAALPEAFDPPIQAYLARLSGRAGPVSRRALGGYRYAGMWSVSLRPQGFHVPHVHPQGWISSACHIVTPDEADGSGGEGWLGFGAPGVPTDPPLAAEMLVRPVPGQLVLFPSYFWHGTTPFAAGERLSVAFDLVPAEAPKSAPKTTAAPEM